MTAKCVITVGDTTSHGGTVNEGFAEVTINGKSVAGVGHRGSCPRCKKEFVIVAGAQNVTMFGRNVALEGMKTSCGAVLIASQDLYKIDADTGSSGASFTASSMAPAAGQASGTSGTASPAKITFDQRFHVISSVTGKPLMGYPYQIELTGGFLIEGKTDSDGFTQKVAAADAASAKLTVFDFEVEEND